MSQAFDLKDILILARQESQRMRHFYLGIEHLFIALVELDGSITRELLAEEGISADYVAEAIRRKVGKGSKYRLWSGIPNTPRTDVVLGVADELMRESQRTHLLDRDIFLAILDERDSIPVRVLQHLNVDIDKIRAKAQAYQNTKVAQRAFVSVEFSPHFEQELDADTLFLLRRAFHSYDKVRIDNQLLSGCSGARLLLVTPIRADQHADASLVVKIAPADAVQDETRRYEQFVERTLPPLAARLAEKPTLPESLEIGLLKYTLPSNSGKLTSIGEVIQTWTDTQISTWLEDSLFSQFGTHWWSQRRPYRFEAWQEYDSVLPPLFTLDIQPNEVLLPEDARVLKFPVKRSHLPNVQHGEFVVLENFLVQKVDVAQKSIALALGQGNRENRALHVHVRGINFAEDMYYRGEVVERLVGNVWQTRDELLQQAAKALTPDFDPTRRELPYVDGRTLPNPLTHYPQLLDTTLNSTLSVIHGDLQLGNILLNDSQQTLLIDYANTREGHTLFDWATLELSLINVWLGDKLGETWHDIRQVAFALSALERSDDATPTLAPLLKTISSVRQIAAKCFAKVSNWHEYHVALVFLCLRAFAWEGLSIANRRLMLYWGALALHHVLQHQRLEGFSASDMADFSQNPSLL